MDFKEPKEPKEDADVGRESADPEDSPLPFSGRGIGEIPLFPLEMVLFPFVPQALHIFEDRYKQMISRCIRESSPFGLVLMTGYSATGAEETSDIGCLARIVRAERLPDGRMNIEVVGESRFRILDTHEQLPYRVGLTEPVDDTPHDAAAFDDLARDVSHLLRDYLSRKLGWSPQTARDRLPDDLEQLAYLAAWVLPVENDEKQTLLAMTSAIARLEIVRDKFRAEIDRMEEAAVQEARNLEWEPLELARFDNYRCPN